MRFMYIVTPVMPYPDARTDDAVHKLAEREIKAGRMLGSGALTRHLGAQCASPMANQRDRRPFVKPRR